MILITSSGFAYSSGSTLIDFDALPEETYLGTEITIGNVKFSTTDDTLVISRSGGGGFGSAPNLLSAHVQRNPPAPGGDFDGDFTMEFIPDGCFANDLEIFMLGGVASFWKVTPFDVDGNPLGVPRFPSDLQNTFPQTLSFLGKPVHRVEFEMTFAGIDDVRFTEESCVPEECPPGTVGEFPECVPEECPPGTVGVFPECTPISVGGELIPLDTTALLLAGTYSVAAWMIPIIVSAIGIGIVIARKL